MTGAELRRKSDYFNYGYNDAVAGSTFSPTNGHLGAEVDKGSYVYREYKDGYDAGLEDR